jgi:hypothetical protein
LSLFVWKVLGISSRFVADEVGIVPMREVTGRGQGRMTEREENRREEK